MIWSASVLSTTTADTEPTVVISFDNAKYIFNVGECTGRAFMESRRGWKNTKALFMTSVGTQRMSGLPGMFMLLADASFKKLDVVGPPGLSHWIASMRGFVYRSGIKVTPYEIGAPSTSTAEQPTPVYKDTVLTVYGIPLYTPSLKPQNPQPSSDEIHADSEPVPCKRKLSRSPEPLTKRQKTKAPSQTSGSGPSSLLERSKSPEFTPLDLIDQEAQEWRRMVVDNMFPCTHVNAQAAPSKGKAKQMQLPPENMLETQIPAGISVAASKSGTYIGPKPKGRRLPPMRDAHPSNRYCYVCVGPKVRGKFDVEKAVQLGVERGPNRAKLARGEIVTFMVDDGKGGKVERMVRPEEVVQPSEAPRVVIIIDMTSPDQIPQLMTSFTDTSLYRQLRSKDSSEYVVSTIYHMCGEDVLEDPRYKKFMNGFADSVNHVVSSRKHVPDLITFGSAALNLLKLNQLDPDIFPVPAFRKDPIKPLSDVTDLPPNTVPMQAGLHIDVRPARPPTLDAPIPAHETFYAAVSSGAPPDLPLPTLNKFKQAQAAYTALEASNARIARPGDDVVVVPLGTSSALPNKYRNVSSTLIQIPGHGNVLLDAGEGTWGQLVRLFGDDPARTSGVWQELRDLKCIFLSHIHGDHHIGLAKILAMRKMLHPPPATPLYVIGVREILRYLREMADIEDLGLDAPGGAGVITILSDTLNWRRTIPYPDGAMMALEPWTNRDLSLAEAAEMRRSLGLTSFTCVDMNHGTRCYGAVLRHADGWSIAYSADTVPTNNLVTVGQNATLLIHEATMADEQEELARAKLHSTFSQAMDVATRMKAQNVLLTHFSARYPKMPQSEVAPPNGSQLRPRDGPEGQADDVSNSDPQRLRGRPATSPTLALAFDHMRIRIGDMRKINTYLPAIEQSFVETLEGDEEEPDPAKDPW